MYKQSLRYWVSHLLKTGRICFSLAEAHLVFHKMSDASLARNLTRLVRAGIVQSVYKGFYVIIPHEYALKGIVPPVVYIDQLMNYLNRKYYIALLDAASFYGSAHQRQQSFSVITQAPAIRDVKRKGVMISYTIKKNIPENLLQKFKTKTGFVNVSSPELTALDLIIYHKQIGGLSRVLVVLAELIPQLNFDKISEKYLKSIAATHIQRLGYLLDKVLEEQKCASLLYKKTIKAGLVFSKTPLKTGDVKGKYPFNDKWKIIENQTFELEE
jgi:predicted transcriptional regulator of viral defense system